MREGSTPQKTGMPGKQKENKRKRKKKGTPHIHTTEFLKNGVPNFSPVCVSTPITWHLFPSKQKVYFSLNPGWSCQFQALNSRGLESLSLSNSFLPHRPGPHTWLCHVNTPTLDGWRNETRNRAKLVVPAEAPSARESPAKIRKATNSPQLMT